MFRRLRIFLSQPIAKRIAVLVITTWLITCLGLYLGWHNSNNKLVASLFSSWMGDVLFFSIVGTALALISGMPAALESYEHRVNILFQGRSGSQVDYAKAALLRLGNYSERMEVSIAIHTDESRWFRLVSTSVFTVKNLIEDVTTAYQFPVIDPEQLSNPPRKRGRVIAFLVDEQQHYPDTQLEYRVEVGATERRIRITREYWVQDGGYVAYSPARFTKSLSLSAVNQARTGVRLEIEIPEGTPAVELAPSQSREIDILPEVVNIEPLNPAYRLRLFRAG